MSEDKKVKPDENVDVDKKEKRIQMYSERTGISVEEIKEKNLTNNYLKRILKRKKWEESKDERRKISKSKRRKKTIKTHKYSMKDSCNKLRICIDYSHNHLMGEKELRKLLKQTQRIYSHNRTFENPCQLHLTSFTGAIKEESTKRFHIDNWDINISEQSFIDLFKEINKKDIIYLSSDSENVLNDEELFRSTSEQKVYIIGGLVDHNIFKKHTLNIANELGISHARLPIPEYVKLKMVDVLTVNQVFEILMEISSGGDWDSTLNKIVPKRKLLCKNKDGENVDDEDKKEENNKSDNDQKENQDEGSDGDEKLIENKTEDCTYNKNE